MTFGNILAILIAMAAMYGAYAFVRTKMLKRPTWPFQKVADKL